MSKVTICHASISENGSVNGKAGDNTGREVCCRSWYSKGWDVMLRYPDNKICYSMANIAQELADSSLVGYSQAERNTLYKALERCNFDIGKYLSSGVATNCDCSSFITVCAILSGIDKLKYKDNAPTTSTMQSKFTVVGFEAYTDSKYLTTDKYLKKGDILIKKGKHTVIAVTSGDGAVNVSVQYYPAYKGKSVSLVDALKAVGEVDTSLNRRKIIAEYNGYKPEAYTGQKAINNALLDKLKRGVLIRP